jgi:hypothetical protein
MKSFSILFIVPVLLAACSPRQPDNVEPTATVFFITATLPPTQFPLPTSNVRSVTPTPTTDPSVFAQLFPGSSRGNELTRLDEQGMVTVEVTPLNLGMPDGTLVFELSMNTHSIDLSMDLAQLATLTTDTGQSVQASLWEAPRGGHHVSGNLIFPTAINGFPILDGATKIRLEIRDVDASLRTFEWTLQ